MYSASLIQPAAVLIYDAPISSYGNFCLLKTNVKIISYVIIQKLS